MEYNLGLKKRQATPNPSAADESAASEDSGDSVSDVESGGNGSDRQRVRWTAPRNLAKWAVVGALATNGVSDPQNIYGAATGTGGQHSGQHSGHTRPYPRTAP